MPILEVIKKNELNNVLVVVIRYFGGIKLGAGGLIRAYSKSAQEAINNSIMQENKSFKNYKITVNYSYSNNISNFLKSNAYKIINITYNEQVCYDVLFDLDDDLIIKKINDLTCGDVILEKLNEKELFIPIKSN